MKKMLALLAALPLAALAAPKDAPAGRDSAPGAGPADPYRAERMHKRMRFALTLGLAEALDLSEAEAIHAGEILARYDARREPLRKTVRENVRVLKRAASGEAAAAVQVDQALQRIQDARGQIRALDQELLKELSKGLGPEKRARAALFLGRFQARASSVMEIRERRAMRRGTGNVGPGPGGFGPGPGGFGPGPRGDAGAPVLEGERLGMGAPPQPEPDIDEWFGDE